MKIETIIRNLVPSVINMRLVIPCALVLIMNLCSCTTTVQMVSFPDQSKTIDDPEKCRVYVINSQDPAIPQSPNIYDGKQLIGHFGGGDNYLCWERPPGEMLISSPYIYESEWHSFFFAKPTFVRSFAKKGERIYFVFYRQLCFVNQEYGSSQLKTAKPPILQPTK